MLGFRVRGWQIWSRGICFIICRDVHLVPRGHVLECRCVESVPAALSPFPRTALLADIHSIRVYMHACWCVIACQWAPHRGAAAGA